MICLVVSQNFSTTQVTIVYTLFIANSDYSIAVVHVTILIWLSLTLTQDTEELSTGLIEEPEITFASTIADESNLTLVEEQQTAGKTAEDEDDGGVEQVLSSVPGLQWIEEQPSVAAAGLIL